MRLIFHDRTTGLYRLRIETPSDLWRVSRFVRAGEVVGASTTRRDPEAPADTPAAQRERRRVWLAVRVEQVEFHGFSHHVRLTGPIVEGPFDLGRHHTLDVGEGDEVTVVKPAPGAAELALLDEGLARRGDPSVLVATVDWGESTVARLRGRAVEIVADVNRSLPGKRYAEARSERAREEYVEELVRLLEAELPAAQALVLAGPGFLKEELAHRLAERQPGSTGKVTVASCAEAGRPGLDELMRSGRAASVLQGSVAAEEAHEVEALVVALGGGLRAAVGPGEVAEATEAGAVETLLVLETRLADPALAAVLDRAREQRARLLIVRADGPPGLRLAGLGGIAARLRYDWRPTQRG